MRNVIVHCSELGWLSLLLRQILITILTEPLGRHALASTARGALGSIEPSCDSDFWCLPELTLIHSQPKVYYAGFA